jgi:preprotein translocase subunit Sec61beta
MTDVVSRFDLSPDPKGLQIWVVGPGVIRFYDETSSSAMATVPRVEFQVMSINTPLMLKNVVLAPFESSYYTQQAGVTAHGWSR